MNPRAIRPASRTKQRATVCSSSSSPAVVQKKASNTMDDEDLFYEWRRLCDSFTDISYEIVTADRKKFLEIRGKSCAVGTIQYAGRVLSFPTKHRIVVDMQGIAVLYVLDRPLELCENFESALDLIKKLSTSGYHELCCGLSEKEASLNPNAHTLTYDDRYARFESTTCLIWYQPSKRRKMAQTGEKCPKCSQWVRRARSYQQRKMNNDVSRVHKKHSAQQQNDTTDSEGAALDAIKDAASRKRRQVPDLKECPVSQKKRLITTHEVENDDEDDAAIGDDDVSSGEYPENEVLIDHSYVMTLQPGTKPTEKPPRETVETESETENSMPFLMEQCMDDDASLTKSIQASTFILDAQTIEVMCEETVDHEVCLTSTQECIQDT